MGLLQVVCIIVCKKIKDTINLFLVWRRMILLLLFEWCSWWKSCFYTIKLKQICYADSKSEPIMLLVWPTSYSFQNFPKFLSVILRVFPYHHHHLIFLYYSLNFYCIIDNDVHNSYSNWLLGTFSVIKIDTIRNTS